MLDLYLDDAGPDGSAQYYVVALGPVPGIVRPSSSKRRRLVASRGPSGDAGIAHRRQRPANSLWMGKLRLKMKLRQYSIWAIA